MDKADDAATNPLLAYCRDHALDFTITKGKSAGGWYDMDRRMWVHELYDEDGNVVERYEAGIRVK